MTIAPLCRRSSDIPGYVRYFLDLMGLEDMEIEPAIMKALTSYAWPGNIRELKNVLERAALLARGNPIAMAHLPGISSAPQTGQQPTGDGTGSLQELEERHIANMIEQCGGDVQKASEVLGISRATLYRKLKGLKDQ